MISKKDLMRDLKFCQELASRLVDFADKNYTNDLWTNHHTVIQADVIRLRRELNIVRQKLDWDWGRKYDNTRED